MAHRGRLLESDADAAARGVFDRLFGLFGEVVVIETVNEEQSGYGERASLSTGADTQANARASPAGWAKKKGTSVVCVGARLRTMVESGTMR